MKCVTAIVIFNEAYTIVQAVYPDNTVVEIFLIQETGYWGFELNTGDELFLSSSDNTIITSEEYDTNFPDDDVDDDDDSDDDDDDDDENPPEISASMDAAIQSGVATLRFEKG